ncbi:MAG TPA: hypothetical protein VJ464_29705 [Blastocatellia bacterium]|nr:hypothetical protein [Blastocatellia bacterium]
MQNVAKKQSATIAMAFLFASLLLTPLSLKAIGISIDLSAGVDAWRHVAGIFTDSYQPASAAELLALNLMTEEPRRDEVEPFTASLFASAVMPDVELNDAASVSRDDRVAATDSVETNSIVESPTARCTKRVRPAPRLTVPASVASSFIMPIEGAAAVAPKALETARVGVPVSREVVRTYEREVANYRFTLGEAMRNAPKEFKVMLKVKTPDFPALPATSTCAFRKALTPEKLKQIRSAWSFATERINESAEKSEL